MAFLVYPKNQENRGQKNRGQTTVFLTPVFLLALSVAAGAAAGEVSPYRLSADTGSTVGAIAPGYRNDARYRLAGPPDTRPYAREIALASRAAGLDPELVHAVVAVESAYQPGAVSAKGAVGLMQLLPETAERYGVRQPAEVGGNLSAGTRYLRELIERFDNRLDLALAAYNAGEGAVRQYGNTVPPYAETRNYVPAVFARYRAAGRDDATRAGATSAARSGPGPRPGLAENPVVYLPGTRLDPRALTPSR